MKKTLLFLFLSTAIFCQTHIKTPQDFMDINKNLSGNYILDNDIDFQGSIIVPIGWDSVDKNKYPEDNTGKGFAGILDGNKHKIKNFIIKVENNDDYSYAGLFAYISGATIKNIKLENPANMTVYGKQTYVGALAGASYKSKIENVSSNVNVSGNWYNGGLVGVNYSSTITNSYSTGNVSGGFDNGGLVGVNYSSTITNSYSTGNVSGDGNENGGLVGWNKSSTITNSYSTGNVSGGYYNGGLVGENYKSTITNSYSTGNVSGGYYNGGLVGYNDSSTITNSYATGNVSGGDRNGGLVGYNDSSTITNSYSLAKSVVGKKYTGSFVGLNNKNSKIENGYSLSISLPFVECDGGVYKDSEFENCKVASQTQSNTISKSVVLPSGFSSDIWEIAKEGVMKGYPILKSSKHVESKQTTIIASSPKSEPAKPVSKSEPAKPVSKPSQQTPTVDFATQEKERKTRELARIQKEKNDELNRIALEDKAREDAFLKKINDMEIAKAENEKNKEIALQKAKSDARKAELQKQLDILNAQSEDAKKKIEEDYQKKLAEIEKNKNANLQKIDELSKTSNLNLEQQVVEYIKNSDVDSVIKMLDEKKIGNDFKVNGDNLLILSANERCYSCVVELSKRINPNGQNKVGQTALIVATQKKDKEIVRKIVSLSNVDVEVSDKQGKTALDYAVANKDKEIIVALSQKSKSIIEIMKKSIMSDDLVDLKKYINLGFSPNSKDTNGDSLLHVAVKNQKVSAIKYLLSLNTKDIDDPIFVNVKDGSGRTPLFFARTTQTIDLLINAGADVMMRDNKNQLTIDFITNKDIREYLRIILNESM